MQSVSFGNVIKVNAPLLTARKVVRIANSQEEPKNKTEETVKSLFPDTKEGRAIAISFDDVDSYIFSGKEAEQFREYRDFAMDEIDRIHTYYGCDECAEIKSERVEDEFLSKITAIILNKKKIPEINVQENTNTPEIKSVDVIA